MSLNSKQNNQFNFVCIIKKNKIIANYIIKLLLNVVNKFFV